MDLKFWLAFTAGFSALAFMFFALMGATWHAIGQAILSLICIYLYGGQPSHGVE